jgi:hypothetical protein
MGLAKIEQNGFLAHSCCHHKVVVFDSKLFTSKWKVKKRSKPKETREINANILELTETSTHYLSKREKRFLDALITAPTVKDAASVIGISVRMAYNVLYRIRRKYSQAREFVNKILAYRRSDPLIDAVLSLKVPLWKEIKEMKEAEKFE